LQQPRLILRIDAGIDGLQQRLPLAASGFQRRDFCLALAAQPSELLLLAGNFRLHVSQLLEIDQQAIDALDARALAEIEPSLNGFAGALLLPRIVKTNQAIAADV
jgi:hypothetical protein